MATEFRPPDRSKHVRPERVKRRTSRQKRERQCKEDEYLGLQSIYLEENPYCVLCGGPANQLHHIVKGVAGRSRSLLNTDTCIGVCSTECHDRVDGMSWQKQVYLKQKMIRATVERLRK
jgi:ferredoxin